MILRFAQYKTNKVYSDKLGYENNPRHQTDNRTTNHPQAIGEQRQQPSKSTNTSTYPADGSREKRWSKRRREEQDQLQPGNSPRFTVVLKNGITNKAAIHTRRIRCCPVRQAQRG
jgi:hypothetical protein